MGSKKDKQLPPLELPGEHQLWLDTPVVMGIVNITPDSFYDGGKHGTTKAAIKHAEKLIDEGADILDLGAQSTRPGAKLLTAKEELKRLLPVLDHLQKKHPEEIISVDTFYAEVAEKAVEHGASIINDVSGGTFDKNMFKTVASLKVPYILMHMQGTPKTMQVKPQYKDIVKDVFDFLSKQYNKATKAGIKQIIIDPGFGFGKTVEHNYDLLRNLKEFRKIGFVLAGLSRKSMINKALHIKPEEALTGTIALNTFAIMNGANILRVHDVKEARQVITLVKDYLKVD